MFVPNPILTRELALSPEMGAALFEVSDMVAIRASEIAYGNESNPEDLYQNIHAGVALGPVGWMGTVSVDDEAAPEVEFGTVNMKAEPFLRLAADEFGILVP